jgi:hypothetical protein
MFLCPSAELRSVDCIHHQILGQFLESRRNAMASIKSAAAPAPEAVAAIVERPSTFIDWPGVFVGVFISIAMSWLLLTFGSAVGLLAVSPYTFNADTAGKLTIAAAIWFALTQIYALGLGAYIAARLRPRAEGPNRDELAFRDGVSGLTVWALAIVLGLVVAGITASSAARTGAEVAGAAANAASRGMDNGYVIDLMFRPAANAQNAQPNTPQPSASRQEGRGAPIDEQTRAMAGRILARSLASGSVDAGDKAYLAQLIAARTGMSQQEAEQRIDQTVENAKNAALAAAEKARQATMLIGFWIVFIMLVAGIVSAWAGTVGGHHRDEGTWY